MPIFTTTYTPFDSLTLVGGVAWDWVQSPENFRNPPLTGWNENGLAGVWAGGLYLFSQLLGSTARGMYSQGLGGVSFDESVRLEPVQLAGFNQSFRTVLSESIAGFGRSPRV